MKKLFLGAGALVCAAVLSACSFPGTPAPAPSPEPITRVVPCTDEGARVTDDSVVVSNDFTAEATLCVLNAVRAPEWVLQRVGSTSAMSGMTFADWDGLSASWTYHPDNGINLEVHTTDGTIFSDRTKAEL